MWLLISAIQWDQPTLLGIAAVVSAIGGIASTIAALRKNRTEEYEHALDELKTTRAEAEALAQELHQYKMGQPKTEHPNED